MLSADDVRVLGDVSDAVFHNPFSEARHELDLRIADAEGGESREQLLDKVLARVRARLSKLGPSPLKIGGFAGSERELVERALLFVAFHDHSGEMDAHIEAQIDTPQEHRPFDDALLRKLRAHGFDRAAAVEFTGIIFQMRRAFYFIDRGLTGAAPCMRRFREQLWSNVITDDIGRYATHLLGRMEDFSTILLGETGSGKGAAAAAIGRSSYIPYEVGKRRFADNFAAAFVPINLSQYPAALIESELFGHRKGAFTGAIDSYAGVFDRCSEHGAVFLDEIGEVSIPVQIKLLRVLQDRQFSAVGGHESRRFSGRVIAATNRDLSQLRTDGRFRDDFYYRLCADVIEVPSLRRRLAEDPDELMRLTALLLERIVGAPDPALAVEVTTAIRSSLAPDYGWPGNVRELEQAVRRTLLGRPYRGDDHGVAHGEATELRRGIEAGTLDARRVVALYCRQLYQRHGTYEEVARRTALDRRTVKKHVDG